MVPARRPLLRIRVVRERTVSLVRGRAVRVVLASSVPGVLVPARRVLQGTGAGQAPRQRIKIRVGRGSTAPLAPRCAVRAQQAPLAQGALELALLVS